MPDGSCDWSGRCEARHRRHFRTGPSGWTAVAAAGHPEHVAFTVGGRWIWRGRNVQVTWDAGTLSGDDDEFITSLRSLDGSGEIVGFDEHGKPILASFAAPEVALETICCWMGEVHTIDGELPPGLDPGDYIDEPRCGSGAD